MLRALALTLAVLLPQDPLETKVAKLVQQLSDDDIGAQDDAMLELSKLGRDALPILRAHREKATGDAKLKLDSVVRKLERAELIKARLGAPVRVTIRATDRPLPEVLEEFRRQSKQEVIAKDLPPDAKVTVSIDNVPCWQALDDICRAHGKVMYAFSDTAVTVAPGAYLDRPMLSHERFFFCVERLRIAQGVHAGGATDAEVQLSASLAWPAGAGPDDAVMSLTELEDDTGTNLLDEDSDFEVSSEEGEEPQERRRQIRTSLAHSSSTPPAEGAEKLAKFRGTVTLRWVLSTKRVATIERPGERLNESVGVDKATLTVRQFVRKGPATSATIDWTTPGGASLRLSDLVLRDAKGAVYPARGQAGGVVHARGSGVTYSYLCAFSIPEQAEIVALDFLREDEVEELSVPFDFKGTSIK